MKRSTAKKLSERKVALAEAQDAFNDAVVEAFQQGASLREIARELDVDHVTISRLLERLGVRKRWLSMADANRELDRRDRLARGEQDD